MDITRITQTNEGISEIVNRLEDLVGGNKYLINHNTPIIDVILLKAMLAWDRAEEDGLRQPERVQPVARGREREDGGEHQSLIVVEI